MEKEREREKPFICGGLADEDYVFSNEGAGPYWPALHFTCNTNGVCLSKCLSGFAFTALQIQKPVAPVEFVCVCVRFLFMWTVGMNVAVERETTKLKNRSGGFSYWSNIVVIYTNVWTHLNEFRFLMILKTFRSEDLRLKCLKLVLMSNINCAYV